MSAALTARERFLARTEIAEVRVPLDREAAATLHELQSQREKLIADYEAEKSRRRKLSDPPVELDLDEIDRQIADADSAIDLDCVLVVLRWRRDVYREEMNRARKGDLSALDAQINVAGRYYEHTKTLTDGEWVDIDLTWDELLSQLNEGELGVIGRVATDLALATDAGPFKKPSGTSVTT